MKSCVHEVAAPAHPYPDNVIFIKFTIGGSGVPREHRRLQGVFARNPRLGALWGSIELGWGERLASLRPIFNSCQGGELQLFYRLYSSTCTARAFVP